jgi:uncharacterized protein YqkB
MVIIFTETAMSALSDRIVGEQPQYLFLDYDVEGCGCVMSGVSQLKIKEEQTNGEKLIETNFLPVLIEEKYEVFFDPKMTIDFQAKYNCFQLKSPNQILNPRMSFVNSR